MTCPPSPGRDRGAILPLVLACTVVMSMVVVALANYATTDLRYATVAQERSDRLSAADAGMRYAVDQLKLRNAGCILDTQEALLPGVEADFNGATALVVCQRITDGFEGITAFAAVITGEGVPAGTSLLSTQGGNSVPKVLGGPVYMSRIDPSAFNLGTTSEQVRIEDGPLFYYDPPGPGYYDAPTVTDPATQSCRSVKPSLIPVVAGRNLVFDPELIFGPACVRSPWTEIWMSPDVSDSLLSLPVVDGSVPRSAPDGSYEDIDGPGQNDCRVYYPGIYTTPPVTALRGTYFRSGDYVFDLTAPDDQIVIQQTIATAGTINTALPNAANQLGDQMNNACLAAQTADVDDGGAAGATFYFAGTSRISVENQGSLEIHARNQGDSYVAMQTLCDPSDPLSDWCQADGNGGNSAWKSTLTATSSPILYTNSGNNREFIAHANVYAPTAVIEFGNVTNDAVQKMLGGLVGARLVLQSSASATNFEIAVPTSPITARILLTSTATKNGRTTSIQSVVGYRPYADDIDTRLVIESSRVCNGSC